mgnify:CR=1 FL=1
MAIGWFDLSLVMLAAFTGTATIAVLWRLFDFYGDTKQAAAATDPKAIGFLLHDGLVVDLTPAGSLLMLRHCDGDPTAHDVLTALEHDFPNLTDMVDQLQPAADFTLRSSTNRQSTLTARNVRGRVQLQLTGETDIVVSSLVHEVNAHDQSELQTLRTVSNQSDQIMWQCGHDGQTLWGNQAYFDLADRLDPAELGSATLSSRNIFPALSENQNEDASHIRTSIRAPKTEVDQWFDIAIHRADDVISYFATDVSLLVQAQDSQRKFMQSLSQTFAQLSIGLAIFDRRRQLATFNPALLDMTSLNFEFMSARPTIDMFLDMLRERRILPEPKNYSNWRDQFLALEAAAKDGSYCEHWNLTDGQTFRVTGKPHPDGGFALLFEDISAEVSLTRRFRAEIETGQAVLDQMEPAIAVFSNAGTMVMINNTYADMWDADITRLTDTSGLRQEISKWQDRLTPTSASLNLRDAADQIGSRRPWSQTAVFDDGRMLRCSAKPISGGMTLVQFHPPSRQSTPSLQKVMSIDMALSRAKV